MRVTVFGSTGGTGRWTIRRLLQSADKHTVVAVARTPAALDDIVNAEDVDSGRLIVMRGDLMDPETITAAVQGADVVVFTAGIASISQAATQKTVIYSQGGKNLLDAMAAAGVKRLVAVTSQAVLSDPASPFVFRFIIKPLLMRDMYEDMRRLEQLITEAGSAGALSWTILRPTKLEDEPTGDRKPQTGEGFLARGSANKVHRADLADLIVAAVQNEGQYSGKTLYIST